MEQANMHVSEVAQTPIEVIEDIRSGEYLLDIDSESEKVKRGARSLQEKLNSALRLLSEDLYSKQTHFVLELVQNADDNDYAPDIIPQLTYKLLPDRLVLVNNEVGFVEKNVRALCDVGKSSKAKKYGYIGEKGIGFKSVFTVSNAPEIHSNGYHFRFDRTNEANLLGYVVPLWCGVIEEAPKDATTIVLPAKDGFQFSFETLEDIDSRLLLFLSKLRELSLQHLGVKVTYRRKDVNGLSHLSTEREESGATVLVEDIRFVRAEVVFCMKDITDEKRPDVDMSSVILAFPIDANGVAAPQPTSQLFAFLPIRQFGFKFSIQADFILNSSREDIHTDRLWNKYLRNCIPVAFKAAVEQFKKTGHLAFSYLKFLPNDSEILDPFFKPVVAQTIALLSETQCLPSANGDWMVPNELRYGGKHFRELFPPDVAIELFGFDYVDTRVKADDDLLKNLGALPITYLDYVNVFKMHGDWFKKQSLEWKAQFYGLLAELDPQILLKTGLASTACVPTDIGDLVVPEDISVFYPLSRKEKYGFESELTIIDSELLDKAARHSSRVKDLFAALMVKTDNPYELVTSHIFPRHKGEAWKLSEHKALVGHVRYIKDKLSLYLSGAVSAGKTEIQAFENIREGVWVGTKQKRNGTWLFDRAKNLYISREYKPPFCIETLLGENINESILVSADYLTSRVKDAEVEAESESWRAFLGEIGVRIAPRLTALSDGDSQCSAELQHLLDSPQSSVRKATLECLDQHWTEYVGHLRYNARVAGSWSVRDTKFAIAMRSMSAPTRRRASIPISQSYYPTQELKELFGDKPAYVDAVLKSTMLLDVCRITHRVDAEACIKRLRQLKAEGGDTTPQLHVIYRNLERLWNNESTIIKQCFGNEGLIRVKSSHTTWACPNEVSWRSNSPFLDSLYPPLQGQYRDFSAFFNDKLGIPRDLPTAKWVQALLRLDEIDSPETRRQEANAIYRRANRDLTPIFGRDETLLPSWLELFKLNEVFLNHRDELVSNNESLFANDAPDLARLFSDDEDISLLAIPFEDIPRVGRLLQALQVQLLSKSVEIQVVEATEGQNLNDLMTRVRQVVPFIGRVLYAKNHAKFEEAIANGLFARLLGIEVMEVPELKLKASLINVTREMSADLATCNNRILIRAGAFSVKDQLATELCKIIGAPEDLADTFARLLMAENVEDIEDFLRIRRIGPIPADIQASLTGDVWTQSRSDENDYEHEDTQSAENLEDEEGNKIEAESSPHDVSVQAGSAEIARSGLEEAPQSGQTGHQTSPFAIEPKRDSRSLETPYHLERKAKPEPTKLEEFRSPATKRPNTEFGDTTTLGGDVTEPMTQGSPLKSSHISNFGTFSGWLKNPRSKRSRGRAHLKRTKTGRLLSYAASPEESQKEWDADSSEKAAARNATGQAAVNHFLSTQSTRWKLLSLMPHNNPGFDVKAMAHDGSEEFIEVKGQSGAWTEEGVALTPTELIAAQRWGDRYWLCVVEHVHDENRRCLYLVQNPFGMTNQFRFDSGWKSVAISETFVLLRPDAGVFIDIPGDGRGRIFGSRKKGQFFKLHIILDDGRQVHRIFNPSTMKLSVEKSWPE